VFDDTRMPYKEKITKDMSWNDIPTARRPAFPTDYLMLRGIFMAGGVAHDQVKYYADLLEKVRQTAEWKEFMEKGAFNHHGAEGQGVLRLGHPDAQLHVNLMKGSRLPPGQVRAAPAPPGAARGCPERTNTREAGWTMHGRSVP
jgi:hypothetical protein